MSDIIYQILFQFILILMIAGFGRFIKLPPAMRHHFFWFSLFWIEEVYLKSILTTLPAQYILITSKLMFALETFIPTAAVCLTLNLYYRRTRFIQNAVYLVSLMFMPLIIFTDLLINAYTPTGYLISYGHGPLFFLHRVWIYGGLLLIPVLFHVNLTNRHSITQIHSRTLYFALISQYLIHLITNVFYPYFTDVQPAQSITIIIDMMYILFYYYILSKKQPPDPITLIKKIMINTTLYLTVFLLISLNIYILKPWLQENFDHADTLVFLFSATLIIVLFHPLHRLLTRLIEKNKFLKKRDYYEALMSICERISEFNETDALGQYVVSVLSSTMGIPNVSLYLFDEKQRLYILQYATDVFHSFRACDETHIFIQELKNFNQIIIREPGRADDDDLARLLHRMQAELLVPIGGEGELSGFILLGRKKSGDCFTSEDEGILNTMTNHLYSALENTKLFSSILNKANQLSRVNAMQENIPYASDRTQYYQDVARDIAQCMDAELVRIYSFAFSDQLITEAEYRTDGLEITLPAHSAEELAYLRTGNDVCTDLQLLLPLQGHNGSVGVLLLMNASRPNYTKTLDHSILQLYANNIGDMLNNLNLYQAIIEAKNYSSGILRAITNIVITIDPRNCLLMVNQSGEQQGFKQNDDLAQNQDYRELFALVIRAREQREEIYNREIKCGFVHQLDYLVSLKFIPGAPSEDPAILVVLTDVTEIKKLRSELLQKERLMTIASMASVIVHEIRNPLTSVSTLSRMMPNHHNDPEYVELFTSVVPKELDRVNELMEDLLELGRTRKLEKSSLNVKQLLEERAKFLQQSAHASNVVITLDVPDIVIAGHEKKLTQVLQNIIQNGIQAMSETGGKLILAAEEKLVVHHKTEVEMCVISITDSGKGMSLETRENIFKPFFTTKEKGTGLGLAITQKIIEDHGGYIVVESEPGAGTQFNIFLPQK